MSRRLGDKDAQQRFETKAEEMFSALSNNTRIAILFALAEAERDTGAPVPFSELYRRIDLHDSSQFNYHLKALTNRFISQTDSGYQLRYVGQLIYRSIKAGEYVDEQILESTSIDSTCYRCGAGLTASFDDGRLIIHCEGCQNLSYRITIPPSALIDRTHDEFLHAADQTIRSDIALVSRGICPYCSGKTVPEIREPSDAPTDNVYINHECVQCGQRVLSTTVGELFLPHPLLVAFCFDHDFDLLAKRCWEIGFCVTDDYITMSSSDPWSVQLELPLDDEVLSMTMDETLSIVDSSVYKSSSA